MHTLNRSLYNSEQLQVTGYSWNKQNVFLRRTSVLEQGKLPSVLSLLYAGWAKKTDTLFNYVTIMPDKLQKYRIFILSEQF